MPVVEGDEVVIEFGGETGELVGFIQIQTGPGIVDGRSGIGTLRFQLGEAGKKGESDGEADTFRDRVHFKILMLRRGSGKGEDPRSGFSLRGRPFNFVAGLIFGELLLRGGLEQAFF